MYTFPLRIIKNTQGKVMDALLWNADSGLYKLSKGFTYVIYRNGITYEIYMPPEYITNFATVPKPFWKLFSPTDDRLLIASCVHDFILNEFHELQPELSRIILINGYESDITETVDGFLAADLFFQTLKQEGSYDPLTRLVLKSCVKGYYFLTTKGFFKVKN